MQETTGADRIAVGFDITTIAIDEYAECDPLDGLAEEAAEIERLLTEFGGIARSRVAPGRTLDQRAVRERLREWAARDRPSSMLVWLGHGASDGVDAWLACFDTPRQIQGNGIVPQEVADQVVRDWHRRESDDAAWALIIFEACGAGTFVARLDQFVAQKARPRRIVLVGVSGDSAGYVGELRRALRRTRNAYENNDQRVLLIDFVSKLSEFLGGMAEVVHRNVGLLSLRPERLVNTNLSAPVDVYREWISFLAGLSPDERNHFVPKAHGAEHGEFAWHFVGRVTECERIAKWLRTRRSGMLVVTGSAGCGKSALLGNVVVQANPALRDLLVRTGRLALPDPTQLPPDDIFDTVVHLSGLTTGELVRRLAEAAGVALPDGEHLWSEEDMDHLVAGLSGRRFTIVADALDEARDPAAIAATVLRRIAQLPDGRVVVGTRPATTWDPDLPGPANEQLLRALMGPRTEIIRVVHDASAIETYARQRLSEARLRKQIDVDTAIIDAVARRLATQEVADGRQFLFARLAVHELISDPMLLEPPNSQLLAALIDGNHRSLFASAVRRLTEASAAAGPLLEALAMAQGRGVPRSQGIWAQMATALAQGSRIGERDIDDLLAQAGPYIMLDAEYEFSVYRLAHETFREVFNPGVSETSNLDLDISRTGDDSP